MSIKGERGEYTPNGVPGSLDQELLNWLANEFLRISLQFRNTNNLSVDHSPPAKIKEGMIRYADGTDWNPGSGKGPYYYNGASWVKM